MENFFTNSEPEKEQEKTPLLNQYDDIKDNYQQIFIEAAESIRAAIDKFKPENPCFKCVVKDCNIEKKDVFTDYPRGCAYKDWQAQILTFLNGEYKQKLKNTYKMVMDKRNEYQCNKCGDCCRLAASEYSYEQLKQRAARGDKYSQDFVSVFVPFESEDKAREVNPEYFDLLGTLIEDTKAYYYYCPKLDGDLCSDYENRPDICKDFPHNPLRLLPSRCSYNAWREEVSRQSMLLNAKVDIIEFYKNRLG